MSENIEKEQLTLQPPTVSSEPDLLELKTEDAYKELRLRGYDYSGLFQGIMSTDNRAATGNLAWSEDWISFIDTMLQFSILAKDTRDLYLPTRLQQAIIDPIKHRGIVENLTAGEGVPVRYRILIYLHKKQIVFIFF